MNHHFKIEHAQLYGLHEAILVTNLHFWIGHNHTNGKHQHDGRTWTYNSVRAFEGLFPYLTYRQIRSSIDALIQHGVLVRGYYNTNPTDRSSWFAFTDEFLAGYPLPMPTVVSAGKEKPFATQGTPFATQGTPFATQGKSLIRTDINTDINTDKYLAADAFEEAWQAYPNRPGKNKASTLKAWNARLRSGSTAEQMTAGVHAYARFCSAMKTEPSYIKQPATFFGPDLHFTSDWAVPAAPSHHTQQDARNRFHDFLNQDQDHDASPARHHPSSTNDPYTIDIDTRRFG